MGSGEINPAYGWEDLGGVGIYDGVSGWCGSLFATNLFRDCQMEVPITKDIIEYSEECVGATE